MLLPTEKHQTFIKFKRGDIVNARGQIGVIVDILRSSETDNICLYVRFVHNLGNARAYDMLEISPERTLGVDKWTLATHQDLEQAIAKRKARLEKEVEEMLSVTSGGNGY
jgi:hypothetical protein